MKKLTSVLLSLTITASALSVPAMAMENITTDTISILYESDDNTQNLSKPVLKVSGITKKTIKLNWDKVKNAEKYQIYYCTEKDGEYKKYGETSQTNVTVKKLHPATEYFFKVRAINGEKKGKFSSILQTNTKFTVSEFNDFMNDLFNDSELKEQFGNVTISCFENSHNFMPFDVWIRVNVPKMSLDLFDYQYSHKLTKKQKSDFIDRNVKLQYLIFSYANRMLPKMKITGGYYDSYYRYPHIKVDSVTTRAFTWVNYSGQDIGSRYSDTKYTGKMKWYTKLDDYELPLTDDMLKDIKLSDILDR